MVMLKTKLFSVKLLGALLSRSYNSTPGYVAPTMWNFKDEKVLQEIINKCSMAEPPESDDVAAKVAGKIEIPLKNYKKFSDVPGLDIRVSAATAKNGLFYMTKIQKFAIQLLLDGRQDILGSAETGSGKTLAFAVPMVSRILSSYPEEMMDRLKSENYQTSFPLSLIVVPTRELAQQIQGVVASILSYTPLKAIAFYGGEKPTNQISYLQDVGCHIAVGTPGRLKDFLERNLLDLRYCSNVIIDEADRMLDMGFEPQIREILENPVFHLPKISNVDTDNVSSSVRITSMFSATFPNDVITLARSLLREKFVTIAVGDNAGEEVPVIPKNINLEFIEVEYPFARNMPQQVMSILSDPGRQIDKALIFTRTKIEAEALFSSLLRNKMSCAVLHGDRSQMQRSTALHNFRTGRQKYLIATAVASRGLDIENVSCVINAGMPDCQDDFVHRVGRTGRMGKNGSAVTLFEPGQTHWTSQLRKLLNSRGISLSSVPSSLLSKGDDSFQDYRGRPGKSSFSRKPFNRFNNSSGPNSFGRQNSFYQSRHGY